MSQAVASHEVIDDARARRNTILLAISQAFYGMSAIGVITAGGLVGHSLADDKGLATLPISAYVTMTACMTMPASMLMRRIGRRSGFLVGAAFGLVGSFVAAYAIYIQSFWLFVFGIGLGGGYQASAQYYRFAAADVASDAFKPKAISWVLIGGIFAAILGPMIIIWTKGAFAPVLFAGCYVATGLLAIIAMAVLVFIDIPKPAPPSASSDARPLLVILNQPRLLVAIFCGMASYGIMNLVMTAGPLAMVGCGLTVDDAAWAIQWHALAMFVPSFFTGNLVARFGKEKIIAIGMALLAGCGIVAITGLSFAHFGIALILLGLGWNLGFVGATAMVTECYRPSERNKVQGLNDFCVFGMVALASFTSGKLLHTMGWGAVNMMLFPVLMVTVILIGWLVLARDRVRAV
jgi:MFS family permease